jgi:hypothetical protein
MTFQDEVEVRRASRGTKVLGFGCAVLAVLGSFWGIVWFIRAYVEAPRVNIPAPMQLASRESVPVPAPAPRAAPAATPAQAPQPALAPTPAPKAAEAPEPPTASITAQAAPAAPAVAPVPAAPVAAAPPPPAADASPAGAIADRWFAGGQFGITTHLAPPAPAAAPATGAVPPPAPLEAQPANSAPAALATHGDAEPIEEVEEGSVPAIAGPAPLPRRKPVMTASAAKRNEAAPPLPRPRPDGPAPQSVWTGVPSSDERFGSQ